MSTSALVMLLLGLAAVGGGIFVLRRPVATEAGEYVRRIGGIMAIAFGLFLVIAAISLRTALAGTVHA